jgi:hypothetical protein
MSRPATTSVVNVRRRREDVSMAANGAALDSAKSNKAKLHSVGIGIPLLEY